MMSLSNEEEGFKPMDLNSLEIFNKEIMNKNEATEPDLSRFKLLFEPPAFEEVEPYAFEAVYHETRKREEIVFKPLIEPRKIKEKSPDKENDALVSDTGASMDQASQEPEETPEEKGYRDGFEKGFEEGMAKGKPEGYENGFQKGEAGGFQKGEAAGAIEGQKKGFEEGYKEGEAKGEKDVRQKAAGMLDTLKESLTMADQTIDLLVDKYEARIISLIQQIAKKAVMAHIQINDAIVKQMILESLKALVNPEEIILSISEEDYEYIEMIKDEFFDEVESLKSISVKSDPSVNKGGCRIETRTASISSDPESRLEAIFQAIQKAGM
ncbi:MAG: FliH/SctL family protein [Desulfobacula sp.]|nr:FliH/SctL family protein [Desulfobacula sp.]